MCKENSLNSLLTESAELNSSNCLQTSVAAERGDQLTNSYTSLSYSAILLRKIVSFHSSFFRSRLLFYALWRVYFGAGFQSTFLSRRNGLYWNWTYKR